MNGGLRIEKELLNFYRIVEIGILVPGGLLVEDFFFDAAPGKLFKVWKEYFAIIISCLLIT